MEELLTGWKAIAKYLGVCERTAMTYCSKKGMPIYRQGYSVWADPKEIKKWRKSVSKRKKDIPLELPPGL
jgi:hypothetical protein